MHEKSPMLYLPLNTHSRVAFSAHMRGDAVPIKKSGDIKLATQPAIDLAYMKVRVLPRE